ncbi:MAG: hypothetical protein AUI57_06685 [Candidatus Rokubacteria bacterium 13_1_40CM_2_68_8]|nr:MAG: hypothetical protein AUI57_06685 [Candidatus Rokubacteria bacterium 13_1_40CM_2_68_8]
MPTCIYCRRTDPPCGFHREHVIPEALGTFVGDVVTLTQEACAECNQHFGDTLERFLNRDSAEAMFRFRHGLKDPAEVHETFSRRVRVRHPRDGSKWGGAYLAFVVPPAGEKEPYVELAPQLACERRDGKGWVYFSEEDLRERADEVKEVVARDCGPVRVLWAETKDAKQRLLTLLAEKGMGFKSQKQIVEAVPAFRDGRVNAELEFTFDKVLARAVAKIGFNYFAKTRGAELALRPDFDPVRRFVRQGEGRPPDFVQFGAAPVLRDFRGRELPARGHLVTVGWDADNATEVIARVCPFQHITYIVRLCANFSGVWRPIESAHLYDLEKKRAERLAAAVRIQLPGSSPR